MAIMFLSYFSLHLVCLLYRVELLELFESELELLEQPPPEGACESSSSSDFDELCVAEFVERGSVNVSEGKCSIPASSFPSPSPSLPFLLTDLDVLPVHLVRP